MAYGVEIPLTHDSECTQRYALQIKKDFETQYQSLPDQFTSPIIIEGLDSSTNYSVRITRHCCNGQVSNIAVVPFTTGA